MPSLDHEVLLLLFRNRPALAAELLRDALGQVLPAYDAAELHDADLSQAAPTAYHADLVVVLRGGAGPRHRRGADPGGAGGAPRRGKREAQQ